MNRKETLLILLLLTVMTSCGTDRKVNQFLNDRYLAIERDYKGELETLQYYISEQPANKERTIEIASKKLDSIYNLTVSNILNSNSSTTELNSFINYVKDSIWTNSAIDWSLYSEIPESIEKEGSLIVLAEISNLVCLEMRNGLGSDDFKFDNIGVFIEPEKTHLDPNEHYKARLYFGVYSSGYIDMITATVNGEEIVFKDGIGQIDVVPKNKGANFVEISVKSNLRSPFWKDWRVERKVEYYVK